MPTEVKTTSLISPSIVQMLWAVFFFSVMNACAKGLTGYPVMEIVFFRCVLSILLSVFWLRHIKIKWNRAHALQLVGRGLSGTLALYFFFLTVQNMPLATAVTIQYLSPIFTAVLAMLFLREKLRPVQWLFFGVSFLGVAALKGFDERISWLYLLMGLLSAMLAGVSYVLVRSLKDKEHPLVVVFYFQLIGTIAGGGATLFDFKPPQEWEWPLLLGIGICAHMGQVNLTRAIQGEKVGVISSLNFLGAIFASLYGWLLFQEVITLSNVMAMSLVITGVLLNIWTNAGKSFGVPRALANLINK